MDYSDQPPSTLRNPGKEAIRQFVIYAENKVGWLNDFISMLKSQDIHVMAISVLDTTDSAVIRMVTNYPKETAQLLKSRSISFTERNIIAVEINDEDSFTQLPNLYYMQKLIFITLTRFFINPTTNLS